MITADTRTGPLHDAGAPPGNVHSVLVVVVVVLGVLVTVVQVVHVVVVLHALVPTVLPVGVVFLAVLCLVLVTGHDGLLNVSGTPGSLPVQYTRLIKTSQCVYASRLHLDATTARARRTIASRAERIRTEAV